MPKQTQYKPNQSQFQGQKMLLRMTIIGWLAPAADGGQLAEGTERIRRFAEAGQGMIRAYPNNL